METNVNTHPPFMSPFCINYAGDHEPSLPHYKFKSKWPECLHMLKTVHSRAKTLSIRLTRCVCGGRNAAMKDQSWAWKKHSSALGCNIRLFPRNPDLADSGSFYSLLLVSFKVNGLTLWSLGGFYFYDAPAVQVRLAMCCRSSWWRCRIYSPDKWQPGIPEKQKCRIRHERKPARGQRSINADSNLRIARDFLIKARQ